MLSTPMRTMPRPRLLVLFALLLLPCVFVAARPVRTARAQQEDWIIRSFDAAYEIRQDGTVLVTENLLVDFGTSQHHGITPRDPG